MIVLAIWQRAAWGLTSITHSIPEISSYIHLVHRMFQGWVKLALLEFSQTMCLFMAPIIWIPSLEHLGTIQSSTSTAAHSGFSACSQLTASEYVYDWILDNHVSYDSWFNIACPWQGRVIRLSTCAIYSYSLFVFSRCGLKRWYSLCAAFSSGAVKTTVTTGLH